MHLFLTSSPSGNPFVPGPPIPVLDESNGFVALLRQTGEMFSVPPACLMLAADPDSHAQNDQMRDAFAQCFSNAGLPFARTDLVDGRNPQDLPALLEKSGFVMLCGGHVPTQNAFFARLDAARALQGFGGIVLGISAGTMNAARLVYAQPELPGEAADPDYCRWLPGLGLTELHIWPHFEVARFTVLDGQRLLEDVAFADSHRVPILCLPDGSFVYQRPDGRETLYGEAWLIENGRMTKLCKNGEQAALV